MDNIPLARGKTLDILASSLGLERKKFFGFIKEPDKYFRSRILKRITRRGVI